MKHFLHYCSCLLLALLTALPLSVRAEELTINDGSSTNDYVPFYGYESDYGTRSQFIIPSSELSSLTSGSVISAMKFYANSVSKEFTNVWSVYLMNTDESAVESTFLDKSDATEVYSGTLTVANSAMEFEFDEEFTYSGGNLLVEFVETSVGAYVSGLKWTGTTGSACYVNGTSSDKVSYRTAATGTNVEFLPKITFTYETPSACAKPGAISISSVTTTSAAFTWSASSDEETSWSYSVYNGETLETSGTASDNPIAYIPNLSPATTYTRTINVTHDCGGDDGSATRTANLTFTTECAAFDIPFSETFDAATLPLCWDTLNAGSNYPQIYNYSYYAHTGSYTLYFYGSGSENRIAILPELTVDANTAMVYLWTRSSTGSSYGNIEVGVMNDPTDASSFVAVATLGQYSTMTLDSVYLNEAPAGYKYIAIRYNGGTSSYGSAYIDDVTVAELPDCLPVTELEVGNITTTSATLTWAGQARAEEVFSLVVKNGDEYICGSEDGGLSVTGGSYTIGSLTANTAYSLSVSVSPSCEGSVAYEKTVSFTTLCEPISEIPYTESFESATSGSGNLPECWSYVKQSAGVPYVDVSSSSAYQGSKYLYFTGGTSVNEVIVALPLIDADLSNARIRFYYRTSYTTATYSQFILGKVSNLNDASTFVEIDALEKVSSYTEYEHDLSSIGENEYIAIKFGNGTSSNWGYIDSVIVEEYPSCFPIKSIALSDADGAIKTTSALVKWVDDDRNTASANYVMTVKNGDEVLSGFDGITVTNTEKRITGLTSATNYNLTVIIKRVCGEGDESEEFSGTVSFATVCETISSLPWTEDFSTLTSGIPTCWSNDEGTTTSDSYKWNYYSGGYEGACVRFNSYSNSSNNTNVLATPMISLPTNAAELVFKCKNPTGGDMSVYIEAEGGSRVELLTGLTGISSWTDKTADLSAYAGQTVQIFFKGTSNWGSGDAYLYLDNITIREIPSCLAPTGLAVDEESITTTSAALSWTAQNSEDAWRLQYKKSADAEWTELEENITENPYTLEGLVASTSYEVRVAAVCGSGESEYCSKISLQTACEAISTLPWTEDFSTLTSGIPTCWSNDEGTTSTDSYKWNYYSGGYEGACVRFNSYSNSSNNTNVLATPMISLPTNAAELVFKCKNPTGGDMSVYIEAEGGSRVELLTGLTGISSWTDKTADLSAYAGQTVQIFFKGTSNWGSGDAYLYLDNITIREIPSCIEPSGLTLTTPNSDGGEFAWDAIEDGAWKYAVALATEDEPADDEFVAVTTNAVTISGKEADTDYVFYLRQDCGDEGVSQSISLAFHTLQTPADPSNFTDDFEDANNWQLINGSITNAWAWGTAANNGGTHALYISDDEGESNNYDQSSTAVVYATKTFAFESGTYVFAYDWKANGESSYDYLRVALVPASVTLTAGTSLPTGVTVSALPEGWIALDGGSKKNLVSTWQSFTSDELLIEAGNYNVVLLWRNDASGGSQTPAAVDNFSIQKITCRKVADVAVSSASITSSEAVVSWTAAEGQSAWQIALGTESDFDPEEATLINAGSNPYTLQSLTAETTYYLYVRANCGDDGVSVWSSKVSFTTAAACQDPDGLAATDVTSSSATITWNAYGATSFSLRYAVTGTTDSTYVSASEGTYPLSGLSAKTSYSVQVKVACSENWSSVLTFSTKAEPTAVGTSFSTGFEDATDNAEWLMYSDASHSDAWYIGTAAAVSGNGIYVSDDGGSSNSYSPSGCAFAYRLFAFEAGEYVISFDWRCYGEGSYSDYDGMQVHLIPSSVEITDATFSSGTATLDGLTLNASSPTVTAATEKGWIPLVIGSASKSWFNQKSSWQTGQTFTIVVDEAGEYNLVLFWRSDSGTQNEPAAGVDNLNIAKKLCGDVSNIHQTAATTSGATIEWDAVEEATGYEYVVVAAGAEVDEENIESASEASASVDGLASASYYTIYVRSICSEGAGQWLSATIYTECETMEVPETGLLFGFEDIESYAKLNEELCYDTICTAGVSSTWTVSTSSAHSGSNGAYLSGLSNAERYSALVMPAFVMPLDQQRLTAYAKESYSHSDDDHIVFWVSETPSLEGALEVGTLSLSTEWQQFNENLPEEASDWDEAYILVQGYAYNTIYLDDVVLETAPECPEVKNIAVTVVDANSISFSWQAGGEESSWQYTYTITGTSISGEGESETNSVVVGGLTANTEYEINISVAAECDGADAEDWIVVSTTKTFRTDCEAVSVLPWNMTFDDLEASTVPECWDNSASASSTVSTSPQYIWGVYEYSSNKMLRMYNFYVNNGTALINTPSIVLPEEYESELVFDYSHLASCGAFKVKISTDNGDSWTDLQSYSATSTSYSYENPRSFTNATISLAEYAGQTIILQFFATANYGSGAIFIDNVKIHKIPTCYAPEAVGVKDITSSSATLYWESMGEDVQYLVSVNEAEAVLQSDTTFVLSELTDATAYSVPVIITTVCSEDDQSEELTTTVSFTTECEPKAELPWSESFEDYEGNTYGYNGVTPTCWKVYSSGTDITPHVIGSGSYYYVQTGTKSLSFYGRGTNYAALPQFEADLNTLQVSFYYQFESSSNGTLTLGYITDDDVDFNTFTSIEDVPAHSGSMTDYAKVISGLPENALRLVIRFSAGYYACCVDDVLVEAQPTCHKPTNVSLVATGAHSASFTWTGNAENYSVEIYNGTERMDSVVIAAEDMPLVVDELDANTDYSFRFVVFGICSEEDESASISTTVAVHTLCEAVVVDVDDLWSENFDELTEGIPDCWSNSEGTTSTASYKWNYFATGYGEESHCVRFNSYSNSRGLTNVLSTPMLTLPEEVVLQLNFVCKNPTGGEFCVAVAAEGGERDTLLRGLTGLTDWTAEKLILSEYVGQSVQIFFSATSNYGSGDAYIYLDDVALALAPTCLEVHDIVKASLTENEVVFSWESNGSETQWDVVVTDLNNENAELLSQTVDVRNVSVALEAATDYAMRVTVAARCGEGDDEVSEAISQDFTFRSPISEAMVIALENGDEYEFDLSDEDEQAKWTILGADEANHFIFGEVEGEAGLFISNDEASWAYTVEDATSASVAYRAFSVAEDVTPVKVSFNWQAKGENNADYGRAFIAPESVVPAISNHYPYLGSVQVSASNSVSGVVSVLNGNATALQGVEAVTELNFLSEAELNAGTYILVFTWRNDDIDGQQNPLGIFDLKIRNMKGIDPTGVDNINVNGVKVEKILRNGQVYILRDGKIYTILGTVDN